MCAREDRSKDDEGFIGILSSVSFIMLKKGDYVKAKAFAEQVSAYLYLVHIYDSLGSALPAHPDGHVRTLRGSLQHVPG